MSHCAPPVIKRLGIDETFSEAVIHAGIVYLSGQVAIDAAGGALEAQMGEVLLRVDALLKSAGSGRDRILAALVHVSSVEHLPSMNRIWREWLSPGSAPARTTVICGLVSPELLIEITVTAALMITNEGG